MNHTEKNKILFDVGANDGANSVPLAMQNPDLIVYAFEPTPEMHSIIESKINGLNNYFLIKKGVSDFNGKAIFKIAGQADWGCSSLLKFSNKSKTEWIGRTDFHVTQEIEIDVIRLDSFIESHKITKIDYLHVDAQGSDLKILQGMEKYIDIVLEGVIEAATKEDVLYEGQNTKEESIVFLQKNNFDILSIQSNDPHENEINIFFKKKV